MWLNAGGRLRVALRFAAAGVGQVLLEKQLNALIGLRQVDLGSRHKIVLTAPVTCTLLYGSDDNLHIAARRGVIATITAEQRIGATQRGFDQFGHVVVL